MDKALKLYRLRRKCRQAQPLFELRKINNMKYRIGEMAEFFGLTKEAIRYYERKGIVTSIRDERTGYRYYERDEITTLKQIRTYESLGFSLDDAQAMAVATTFSEDGRKA